MIADGGQPLNPGGLNRHSQAASRDATVPTVGSQEQLKMWHEMLLPKEARKRWG